MKTPTLAEALSTYGPEAYLLTVAADGPHTSFVSVQLDGAATVWRLGEGLSCMGRSPDGLLFQQVRPSDSF